MKIAVLSDCRVPTRATGGHGLGRMAWDLATGLRDAGHFVTLYAGRGSEMMSRVVMGIHADESERARSLALDHIWLDQDAVLDLSHKHDLSRMVDADRPIVNWLVDLECDYTPPRAVVGNAWQALRFPAAKRVPLGIDVEQIPLDYSIWGDYLAFAAKMTPHKGADVALEIHTRQPIPVRFVGERFGDTPLPWHRDELTGLDFYRFLGGAWALLSPSRRDAGGRVNLEAAACGCPVLCLDGTGTAAHVEHGVSGFICRDVDELVDAIPDCALLDRVKMRAWVQETHDLSRMVNGVEQLLEAAAEGEAW